MLNQQTIDKLHALKLSGMVKAFNDQLSQPDIDKLSFEERFGLNRPGIVGDFIL